LAGLQIVFSLNKKGLFMINKKLAIITIALLSTTTVQAQLLDFNGTQTGFYINTSTSDGFTETMGNNSGGNIAINNGSVGAYWNGNGSNNLLSWTNGGLQSGFILTDNNPINTFSVTSFDFGNGYSSGINPVTSLEVIGTLLGGTQVSETFVSGWTSNGLSQITLESVFTNLTSLQFIAFGADNRATFDNIVVNQLSAAVPAAVPVPAAVWLFASGLLGLGALRKKVQA
jgi:hypothetical protein